MHATAATLLLELKVPLPAVMELMGWSNAAIAKRYMHVNEELVMRSRPRSVAAFGRLRTPTRTATRMRDQTSSQFPPEGA